MKIDTKIHLIEAIKNKISSLEIETISKCSKLQTDEVKLPAHSKEYFKQLEQNYQTVIKELKAFVRTIDWTKE